MTIRFFFLTWITLLLVGVTIAFLWVQTGIPGNPDVNPWDGQIRLFPTFFAAWIPCIYLFFTSIWIYLNQELSRKEQLKYFFKLDVYSYAAIPIFFLFQIAWREFESPEVWFRALVLAILLLKSVILLRALYTFPQLIQPTLLITLSIGFYFLLSPFTYISLSFPLIQLFQYTLLLHIGMLAITSVCLSVMLVEMFRLSIAMTKSVRSAFFSWLIVSFTFPVIGFPKLPYILIGLLMIFILRMIISRLDTRELMKGLLEPTSITISIKLLIVLAIIGTGGLVFWSNIKPDIGIQWSRAFEATIGTLFDGQFGLLCYTPVYWLALFGVVYLIFFRVWDGVLLTVAGSVLYVCSHLAIYGMLGRIIDQDDIIPFLPFIGVFIAVAHHRFGKLALFRICVRIFIIGTIGINSLFIVLYPNFLSIVARFAEIQRYVMMSLGRDLSLLFPSMIFRLFSGNFLIWMGGIIVAALICCYIRTRAFFPVTLKMQHFLDKRLHVKEFIFFPFLLLTFLFIGATVITHSHTIRQISLDQPISLSQSSQQQMLSLSDPPMSSVRSRGLLIVSNLTNSVTIPHETPIATVSVVGQDQRFETFTLKTGRDTAEESFGQQQAKNTSAHSRAAVYRSWILNVPDGRTFEAHDYYTKLFFSKPLDVQKITVKLLISKDSSLPSNLSFHLKEVALLE